jgi:8-oxo-dGTP pyrophosphatase MutT (NUDIX family)
MNCVCIAAHGLIKKGDRFLVTKRSVNDDFMPGLWDVPGGKVEFRERAVDGLVREIDEETGLKVNIGKILYCYDSISDTTHHVQLVFECEYQGGEVILSVDHDEYRWVTMEEAGELEKIGFLESLLQYLK